jgi:ATP-independent RNA helicase DbpA
VHITVGTPGRILDLIYKGKFFLEDISTVVLDEADKMLELGFEADIKAILSETPREKQTVFFSATYPDQIDYLSKKYQNKPVHVSIEDSGEEIQKIDQVYYEYQEDDKVNVLIRVLQQHPSNSTIIFCNQKVVADELVQVLKEKGASCSALHGNLEQMDRDKVMAQFRNGSYRILVATDVAARGLDIDHLELVINYDFPLQPDTYVHRIGRTGRAGKSGTAVTLIKPEEERLLLDYVDRIKAVAHRPQLGFKNQHGIPPELLTSAFQTLSISAGRKNK